MHNYICLHIQFMYPLLSSRFPGPWICMENTWFIGALQESSSMGGFPAPLLFIAELFKGDDCGKCKNISGSGASSVIPHGRVGRSYCRKKKNTT